MNTYSIDANKLNYSHPNRQVYNRVKKLFSLLDDVILDKTKYDLHIISREYMQLLNKDYFQNSLCNLNIDVDAFDKFQSLYYILIKHKHFQDNNPESNNTLIIFFTKSLIKYIGNNGDRFFDIMRRLPKFDTFNNEVAYQLWDRYNEYIMYFIISYGVFPYLIEAIFDHRRICTKCGKISDEADIRCHNCRVFYYCSITCQRNDHTYHKKICPNVYSFRL